MRRIFNLFIFIFISLFYIVCFSEGVKANYSEVCKGDQVETNSIEYSKCDDSIIYLLPGNKHSSYIVSIEDNSYNKQILYAGKQNGLDTFYTGRFNLYHVVYDDRGLFTSDENYWMDLSINGAIRYTGEFNDNMLVDESETGFTVYNEVGTYILRQYYKGKMVSAIRVIVVDRFDTDLFINKAFYGDSDLESNEVIKNSNNLVFDISGGKYGFDPIAKLSVNSCDMELMFSKQLIIDYGEFSHCLLDNDKNKIVVTLKNGLNMESVFTYKFKLVGEHVSIKLVNSISTLATSSRRILIKASAGKDSELDTNYSLYYWSKNPNDGLNYSDFMTNYEKSENKGTYTSSAGVILRNEEGTYYLYALAKDGNSEVVVRSDEYVLTNKRVVNKVNKSNVIFVAIMVVIAALPIFIYLLIREKDTI